MRRYTIISHKGEFKTIVTPYKKKAVLPEGATKIDSFYGAEMRDADMKKRGYIIQL